jgi:hypothetical protein
MKIITMMIIRTIRVTVFCLPQISLALSRQEADHGCSYT